MYTYKTTGTCAKTITSDIIDGKLHDVKFDTGCPGNLIAIGKLIEGKDAQEVADLLEGTRCGARPTSCSDQLAKAIRAHLEIIIKLGERRESNVQDS